MSPRLPAPALALAVALTLVTAACGGGGDKKTTTTTAPPETTTTAPVDPYAFPAGGAPLTALPAIPDLLNRPALVVKLDNAPKGRPQAGILQADIVVVEKVEDGVTRLFTIFQSQDADVGPVRSARSTDITLASSLNRPLFSYSGTNATFQALIGQAMAAGTLVDVGINAASGDYRRQAGRPAPYNLFSSTAALYRKAPAGSTAPKPQFVYRPGGQPLGLGTAAPQAKLHIEYVGKNITTVVDYDWDAATGTWKRFQDGTPHVDAVGGQASPKNVIVQFTEYVDTGQRDTSNTIVPEGKVVGTGEAWIFTDGKVVKGTWTKADAAAVTTYTDSAGAVIPITPGQTWVELPPPGAATSS